MKRFLIYLFVAVLALSQTGMTEVLKLPFVFAHYLHHCAHGDQDSFFGFLTEHYGHEGCKHGNEQDDHNCLPFHCADCVLHLSSFVHEVDSPELMATTVAASPTLFHYSFSHFPTPDADIWQPPKI
ncbi:MAG: hypothetical protein JNM00_05530 [Flavobacteriales bacterium]|nr:hypothetical protein [Flavobacteriales bacterium]